MKISLIGLDGVGVDALKMFLPYMDFLRGLLKEFGYYFIDTIPPYTPPIWTSIITGVNPGKHSIIGFTVVKFVNNKFIQRIATSYDVKYPRIWEYLSMFKKKSIIINFPLTYPFDSMYLRDNVIIIPGWDSPKLVTYPSKIGELFPNVLSIGNHEWSKVIGKEKAYIKNYLRTLKVNLQKRIQALKRLLLKYKHDLFAIIFSETDWIQHLVAHSEQSIKEYEEIQDILIEIDEFIRFIVESYDYTLVASDHDHHSYNQSYNIVYPLIKQDILDIYIDARANHINLCSIFNIIISNKYYKRFTFLSRITRKIFISSLARLLNGKIKYKNIWIAENNIGIYLAPSIKTRISEIKHLYQKELGIVLKEANKLYWGPYLDNLPDLLIDFKTMDRSYGIINEPVLRKVIKSKGRDHFPDGILIVSGEYVNKRQCKYEYIKPWDIGSTILIQLINKIPQSMDGTCISALECDYKRIPLFKKLILARHLSRIKTSG